MQSRIQTTLIAYQELLGTNRAQLLRSQVGRTVLPALEEMRAALEAAQGREPPPPDPDDVPPADRRFVALRIAVRRALGLLLRDPDLSDAERRSLAAITTALQHEAIPDASLVEKIGLRTTLPQRVASVRDELERFRTADPRCLPALVDRWIAACGALAERHADRTARRATRDGAPVAPVVQAQSTVKAAREQLAGVRVALVAEARADPTLGADYVARLFDFADRAVLAPRKRKPRDAAEEPAPTDSPTPPPA